MSEELPGVRPSSAPNVGECGVLTSASSSTTSLNANVDEPPDLEFARPRRSAQTSKVCDAWKRYKRKCDLQETCGNCEVRNHECSYTRYSLGVKFPRMAAHDLDLLSQLLNELTPDGEAGTTSATSFGLAQHSARLGVNVVDLLASSCARSASSTRARSVSFLGSTHLSASDRNQVDDNPVKLPKDPLDPRDPGRRYGGGRPTRQTRSMSERGGLASPITGAHPPPLPPASGRLVDPVEFHFPRAAR